MPFEVALVADDGLIFGDVRDSSGRDTFLTQDDAMTLCLEEHRRYPRIHMRVLEVMFKMDVPKERQNEFPGVDFSSPYPNGYNMARRVIHDTHPRQK